MADRFLYDLYYWGYGNREIYAAAQFYARLGNVIAYIAVAQSDFLHFRFECQSLRHYVDADTTSGRASVHQQLLYWMVLRP